MNARCTLAVVLLQLTASSFQLCVARPSANDYIDLALPAQDFITADQVTSDRDRNDIVSQSTFKYKYVSYGGYVYNQPGDGLLEIASTTRVSSTAEAVGIRIVSAMIRYMPQHIFLQLARRAKVGLFTSVDKTTIFPEYAYLRDRPECRGTCSGSCSNTCTGDGRKYDSLAGVGGERGTCLDDNFMCTAYDPYYRQFSVLVHEFGHTIHLYGLPGSATDYYNKIDSAWRNAYSKRIWTTSSYAMSNAMEYFAEGTGVFFNSNRHPSSNGGMNGCGKPSGQFCSSETEARAWLQRKDPLLYEVLSYVYTNNRPTLSSGLSVCVS